MKSDILYCTKESSKNELIDNGFKFLGCNNGIYMLVAINEQQVEYSSLPKDVAFGNRITF